MNYGKSLSPMLFATDLDGTLAHGSKEDLLAIFDLCKKYQFKLAYVTGRDISNFRKLSKSIYKEMGIKMLYPDYLITVNGAKIYKCRKNCLLSGLKWSLDKDWFKEIKPAWNKKTCKTAFKSVAKTLRFDENLPALVLVNYKPSPFYLESVVHHQFLDQIREEMLKECDTLGINVNVIFDYLDKKYVDMGLKVLDSTDKKKAKVIRAMRDQDDGVYVMMLSASNKGLAVKYICNHLEIEEKNIIVAGDGGNDFYLLSQGFNSIVVNNAHTLLLKKPLETINEVYKHKLYFAKQDGAKGILEGLEYFKDLYEPLSHRRDSCLSSVADA